ncbi:MAG: hypothetical protein JXA18_09970 [Chitinispirillaceae bacterium]|nr:hypothetical protein [Chitinispirillaceae bacterium]
MYCKPLMLLVGIFSYGFSTVSGGYYANVSEALMATPISAAMAGSDLSVSSGASVEGTPGNLPFDSLNRLSLAYAGYFHNSFSTSMLTWSGKPWSAIGTSLLVGYVHIPDILDTRESSINESGELKETHLSMYSASKVFFRAGIGRRFNLTPDIALGAGAAVNAKRFRLPDLGYGISLDAGIKSLFSKPGIAVAIQVENLTSSYIYWNESFQERSFPHLRAGIGWERAFPYIYGVLRVCYASPDLLANEGINDYTFETTDNNNTVETPGHYTLYEKPSLLATQGRIGAEYTVFKTVVFRTGIANRKFGFGAGLRLWKQQAGLDFAYIAHDLAETYQLSAHYSW